MPYPSRLQLKVCPKMPIAATYALHVQAEPLFEFPGCHVCQSRLQDECPDEPLTLDQAVYSSGTRGPFITSSIATSSSFLTAVSDAWPVVISHSCLPPLDKPSSDLFSLLGSINQQRASSIWPEMLSEWNSHPRPLSSSSPLGSSAP